MAAPPPALPSALHRDAAREFMHPDIHSGRAHDPGPGRALIQPHGVLLAIDADGRVARLAGDTLARLGRAPQELLGSPLAAAFRAHGEPEPTWALDAPPRPRHVACWSGGQGCWDVAAHRTGRYTLIEFEPAPAQPLDVAAVLADLGQACEEVDGADDIAALCHACAQAVRRLSGYDRVSVHHVTASGESEAMAWSAATLSPSDAHVPWLPTPEAQALPHAIPDVGYLPAPVWPDPEHGDEVDLRHCILRSAPPAWRRHLERLGVAAVLSFPILVEGRTWGIVTCHHAVPRFSPSAVRASCERVVRTCASRIEACRANARQRQAAAQRVLREESLLLVQEANHRVQNSLQIVASMLRMQGRQAGDARVRAQLEAAAGRLATVSAAHRQLSLSAGARGVPLDSYLGQLCQDLAASWGEAWVDQVTVDVCPATLAADATVTLGLVVAELLTNAVKYAYRGAPGPIRVSADRDAQWLRVTVSDQGQGIDHDTAGSGLGSRLTRIFAAQLGGAVELSSGHGGTTAVVRVPLSSIERTGDPARPAAGADAS